MAKQLETECISDQVTLQNGVQMPLIALGTSRIGIKETIDVVKLAIHIGYRHIDTAQFYFTKTAVGEAISQLLSEGNVKREELFVTAKLTPFYENEGDIERGLRTLLSTLHLDYVDACLLHLPVQMKDQADPHLNMNEVETMVNEGKFTDRTSVNYTIKQDQNRQVWKEMEQLIDSKLTRTIGLSNFNIKQIQDILDCCTVKPHIMQVESHAYFQNKDLIRFCKDHQIFVTAYAPLGSPGKEVTSWADDSENLLKDETVGKIALAHRKTPAQVLLRYNIQRGLGVVFKSSREERLRENLNVFDFCLTQENIESLSKIDKNQRVFTFEYLKNHPQYPF